MNTAVNGPSTTLPLSSPATFWQRTEGRLTGLVIGLGTHGLFAFTVYHLFCFLHNVPAGNQHAFVVRDLVLASCFALPHSLLLAPPVQRMIKRRFPAAFYGCLFCVSTCVSLLLTFAFWQHSSTILWDLTGIAAGVVRAGFYLSWAALLYSISLTGLGYQTGWTPWWYWWMQKPEPRRKFVEKGAYRWLRHPIYLSFLGLIWFTPRMSLDHALLTGVWTGYIFLGSYFKDRRLLHYLGDTYREYAERVPGYPGMPFGPLARFAKTTPMVTGSLADSAKVACELDSRGVAGWRTPVR